MFLYYINSGIAPVSGSGQKATFPLPKQRTGVGSLKGVMLGKLPKSHALLFPGVKLGPAKYMEDRHQMLM